jgi:ATP-binding cassette subfamily F protein 3
MDGGQRGVLLVSHDRWLLDRLCTHIWELDDGSLHRYMGGYTKSTEQRAQRREQAALAYQRQREQIARTEEYIRRNIAGQNTRQAQGRRTHLARMERLEKPSSDPQMAFVLKPAVPTGEQVLVVEDLSFSYGRAGTLAGEVTRNEQSPSSTPATKASNQESVSRNRNLTGEGAGSASPTNLRAGSFGLDLNPPLDFKRNAASESQLLIDHLSFHLMRMERMAIVGANGTGKTTLLKLLTRRLSPQHGLVAWGSNVELGIFSQDSADLSAGRNLLAELRDVEASLSDGEARSYLARFGFTGDDVLKDVGALSGGERSRLSLAKIFRRRPNVLVLDEPTNHLDIYAREALEQFLAAYEGTIAMVTHDRALLERLCNRLVVFEGNAEDTRRATFFRGDYEQYVNWREAQKESTVAVGAPTSNQDKDRGMPTPRIAIDGLPSLAELTDLARQQRTSVEGYCRKQADRERKRAAETEAKIEKIELGSAELLARQRAADAAGNFGEVTKLQVGIEHAGQELECAFDELHEIEERVEDWERMIDLVVGI